MATPSQCDGVIGMAFPPPPTAPPLTPPTSDVEVVKPLKFKTNTFYNLRQIQLVI